MKAPTGIYTAFAAVLSIFVSDLIDFRDGAATVGLRSEAEAATAVTARVDDGTAWSRVEGRHVDDMTTMETFRPGYAFWQNVFTIPDGSIAFGSAVDGRHLATFPVKGDWIRDAEWADPALAAVLENASLPRSLDDRRDYVAARLESVVGPVLHNPTRGRFLAPGAQRYGRFLAEWGTIYERFGVPAEIGLAQALIESGFDGPRRSEAGAIGLCQWLKGNWKQLDRLSPAVLEAPNQTTQAAYCAAYLSVLGTKYGSFIPALSEHHAGGTNVARTVLNGGRLGGEDTRQRYFLGAELARDLRALPDSRYSDIYGTYGPRSYRYAEMVFGNLLHVRSLTASTRQIKISAMRTTRAIPIAEIRRRTGLSADEVRRFNPALVKRVPAGATLYLPKYVSAFGRDVAFWHKPASTRYAAVLNDFVRLDAPSEEWNEAPFEPTLREFERRFRATGTEEGSVMATVLAYVEDQAATSGRRELLAEFRTSERIRDLFERAVQERTYSAATANRFK
jgi:hypothetical protein